MHKIKLLFSKHSRLKTHKDYSIVFDGQQKSVSKYFVVYRLDNNHSFPRLGVVASKKQAPRAVDRNRLKRLIKESVRLKQNNIPALDLVFVVRRSAVSADNHEVRRCLSWIIKQLAGNSSTAPFRAW